MVFALFQSLMFWNLFFGQIQFAWQTKHQNYVCNFRQPETETQAHVSNGHVSSPPFLWLLAKPISVFLIKHLTRIGPLQVSYYCLKRMNTRHEFILSFAFDHWNWTLSFTIPLFGTSGWANHFLETSEVAGARHNGLDRDVSSVKSVCPTGPA